MHVKALRSSAHHICTTSRRRKRLHSFNFMLFRQSVLSLHFPPLSPGNSHSTGITSRSLHCTSSTMYEDDGNGNVHDNGYILREKKTSTRKISFLTDVEGDAAYLDRFVEMSEILDFVHVEPRFAANSSSRIHVNHDMDCDENFDYFPYDKQIIFKQQSSKSILVYGGDLWDKGGSDLYVSRQLLSLYKRYAGDDRVFFLMGNRDINKMRILQEIVGTGEGEVADMFTEDDGQELMTELESELLSPTSTLIPLSSPRMPHHRGVYWLKGSGLTGDPDLISQNKFDAFVPSESRAERLKWILKNTMGSPDAFELRRRELEQEEVFYQNSMSSALPQSLSTSSLSSLTPNVNSSISDEKVVESYLASCHPVYGLMGQYLSKAKLVVRLGNVIFMHGALPITSTTLPKCKNCKNEFCGNLHSEQSQDEGKNNKNSVNDKENDDSDKLKVRCCFWPNFFIPWIHQDEFEIKQDIISDKYSVNFKNIDTWIDDLNSFASNQIGLWRQSAQLKMGQNSSGIAATNTAASSGHNSNDEKLSCRGDEQNNIWATKGGYQHLSSSTSDCKKEDDISFGSLLQYGMGWLPDKSQNPTVVYANWLKDGMPRKIYLHEDDGDKSNPNDSFYSHLVRSFMDNSNLDLIITGHQPIGDMPLPIRVNEIKCKDDPARFVICSDTSYSGDTNWFEEHSKENERKDIRTTGRINLGRGKSKSGRGDFAVSEVLIDQCIDSGEVLGVKFHGTLSDGSKYESSNLREKSEDEDTLMVGKIGDRKCFVFEGDCKDGNVYEEERDWWVKAKLKDGAFILSSAKGFEVSNIFARKR